MARKQPRFVAGRSQMFCILAPPTKQAEEQLWAYTAFTNEHDADAYLKERLGRLGRSAEGFQIVPCEVSLRLALQASEGCGSPSSPIQTSELEEAGNGMALR